MQNGYEDDVLRWYAFVLMIWIVERTFFFFSFVRLPLDLFYLWSLFGRWSFDFFRSKVKQQDLQS